MRRLSRGQRADFNGQALLFGKGRKLRPERAFGFGQRGQRGKFFISALAQQAARRDDGGGVFKNALGSLFVKLEKRGGVGFGA